MSENDKVLTDLTEFRDYLFKVRKVSVPTIKNYRSAIAHYWRSNVGYEIPENDKVLTDLFRGFLRDRPKPHRHVVDWDVRLVLKFFPIRSLQGMGYDLR